MITKFATHFPIKKGRKVKWILTNIGSDWDRLGKITIFTS